MDATVNDVTILFKNGESLRFRANEFNIDVNSENIANASLPHRFTYLAPSNRQVPIYLTLSEVAGIAVSPRTAEVRGDG